MLARRFKIGSRPRIEHILKKGRVVRTRLFQLRFLPNARTSNCRFSAIVSKKVGPTAVERNKIRRRIYEALRTTIDALHVKSCYDVIVMAYPLVRTAEFTDLGSMLSRALNEIS